MLCLEHLGIGNKSFEKQNFIYEIPITILHATKIKYNIL